METPEKIDLVVNVDVHSEMDSKPPSKLTSKPKRRQTIQSNLNPDEIFAIEDGVEWKKVAENLDFYRIKDHKPCSDKSNVDLDDGISGLMSSVQIQDDDESGIRPKRAKSMLQSTSPTSNIRKVTERPSRTSTGRTERNLLIYETDENIAESWVSVGKREADQPCAGNKSKRLRTTNEDSSEDVDQDEKPLHCQKCEKIEDMESSDVNTFDDFDMLAASPSYTKGQLNTNASYSYRTHFYLSPNQSSFDANSPMRNARRSIDQYFNCD